jgi:hypothetical protein
MGKSERSLIVPVLLICGVVGVGVAAYVKLAPADVVPVEAPVEEQQNGGSGVQLLTPYYANDELRFRTETVEVPENVDPRVFAVNRYLRTTEFVPPDAEIMTVTVSNRTATLDFNAAFNTSYGTTDESTVINGILAVMGQFDDVDYVVFLAEGQPIESLGNLELTDPLPVTRLPQTSSGGEPRTTAKS